MKAKTQADPGYTYFSAYASGVTEFLDVAPVCTQWYHAAIPLIYTHCQVQTTSSLELLCRTLTESEELSSRVRSISNFGMDCPAAWNSLIHHSFERDKPLDNTLARLCKVISKTVDMEIQLCASSIPRLVSLLSTSGTLLISLHIKLETDARRKNMGIGLRTCFPHLRTLTLEGFTLDDQSMWPNMPQLRCLRIMRCSLFETSVGLFAGLPPLSSVIRVEIITSILKPRDSVHALSSSELKTKIQDLVVFDSFFNMSTFALLPSSAIHYSSLRRLTLATYRWPDAWLPSAPFSDLEVLTMMQLHPGETCFRDERADPISMLKIICSLLTQVHLTPSVTAVRVRCFDDTWNTTQSTELEEIMRERHLHLEVRTTRCEYARLLYKICSEQKI